MSKYEPLWRFLSGYGSGCIQFSFERIEEILGFPMDHSFLNYKQEAEQYGYRVEKISLKKMGALCPHCRTVTSYLCKTPCFPI